MARPLKAELKDSIQFRCIELKLENPLHKISQIVDILAAEFDLSARSVWYHLRVHDTRDHRVKYTEAERARIADMSHKELEAYAQSRGVSPATIYAVGWRYKNAQKAAEANLEAAQCACEALGRLNFIHSVDLRAFGLPRSAYKDARREIRKINGLDLAAPNYLLHPITHRFYELTLADQRFLLTKPRRFLAERAAHINAHWRKFNPSEQYLVVVDTRTAGTRSKGVVVSTHNTMDCALRAVQACACAKPPIPASIYPFFGTTSHLTKCVHLEPGEIFPERPVYHDKNGKAFKSTTEVYEPRKK